MTLWGVHDMPSWTNDYPARRRTNSALPYGRDRAPKLAFDAVLAVLLRTTRQLPSLACAHCEPAVVLSILAPRLAALDAAARSTGRRA